jgi:hypothetical protein
MYFTKLHGSIALGGVVLTGEEYNETYLQTPKMDKFLCSLMMTSSIVFIGCSLEDYVVQLRRVLTAQFSGHIPLSYAILPASEKNIRRAEWLRDITRIDPVFYADGRHSEVDLYLKHINSHCCSALAEQYIEDGTAKGIARQVISKRWSEIGEINRELIQLIFSIGGSIAHADLVQPAYSEKPTSLLANISGTERLYRVLFLSSIGLMTEMLAEGAKVYLISASMQSFLESLR